MFALISTQSGNFTFMPALTFSGEASLNILVMHCQAGFATALFIMRSLAALKDFVLPAWHKIVKV